METMPRNSKTSLSKKAQALTNFLNDGVRHVSENTIPHPIKHDASRIDHPLWPYMSLLGRSGSNKYFNEFLCITFRSQHHEAAKKASQFEATHSMEVISYVIHLTTAIGLPKGRYIDDSFSEPDLWAIVMSFCARPLFLPLLLAAGEARSHPLSWFSFVGSTRLEGFLENAIAIGLAIKPKDCKSPEEELAANRDEDAPYLEFLLSSHFANSAPSNREEMDQLCAEWAKANAASKKRLQRLATGGRKRSNRFRQTLLSRWLVDALWCRSTAEIADLYPRLFEGEQAADFEKACVRIDGEISGLGLSGLRSPQHGMVIEKAIKAGRAELEGKPLN